MTAAATRGLGLGSGIGLVSSNMIGSGVFLSAGFMAQTMSPELILWSWAFGLVLALAGARAYAELAALVPRSGGEYRFLKELVHPWLGVLAGWASLLAGFAAPVAINALGAAGFLGTLGALPDERVVATAIIAWLTVTHAIGLTTSRRTQDLLAALKLVLVIGFVAVGLALGRHALPAWSRPPGAPHATLASFMQDQTYVAFAFSGWNAAIYVAEEFRQRRDVVRAMVIGCVGVGLLYLAVNFVLVANLTAREAALVAEHPEARVTLGHLVAGALIGEAGGALMSILAVIAFVSAASAMTYVGPRIYAAMAADGVLPRALEGRDGRPPAASIVFQGAVATAVVWLQGLQGALQTAGAFLILFGALACAALFGVALRPAGRPRPAPLALVAAAIYVVAGACSLYFVLGWLR
jgi:APA family basic amino acid/polyamine antiporter